MTGAGQQLATQTLAATLERFRIRMGYDDYEVAAWLELPVGRLPALAAMPLPWAGGRRFAADCTAVAAAAGCDRWSLALILIWERGAR